MDTSKFNHLFFSWNGKKYPDRKYRLSLEAYNTALELNSLTLDTIYFLFCDGVEINDGFIMEV